MLKHVPLVELGGVMGGNGYQFSFAGSNIPLPDSVIQQMKALCTGQMPKPHRDCAVLGITAPPPTGAADRAAPAAPLAPAAPTLNRRDGGDW